MAASRGTLGAQGCESPLGTTQAGRLASAVPGLPPGHQVPGVEYREEASCVVNVVVVPAGSERHGFGAESPKTGF